MASTEADNSECSCLSDLTDERISWSIAIVSCGVVPLVAMVDRLPLDFRMSRWLGGLMRRVDDETGPWVIVCPISNRGGGRYAGELNATITRRWK